MAKRLCAAAVLALTVLITGCAASGGQSVRPLTVAENGASEFRIVYSGEADPSAADAAESIAREIERLCGAALEVCEDMSCEADSETYEILVGGTDRPESTAACGEMGYIGEYLACVQGRKLALVSTLPEHLQEAAEALCERLAECVDDKDCLVIPADFRLSENPESGTLLAQVPAFPYGAPVAACQVGAEGMELIFAAGSADFDAYGKDLAEAGFAAHAQNAIDDNRYATLTSDAVVITLMDTPALSTVRMTVEPRGILPESEPAAVTAVVQPSVTMIGQTGGKYGMCFIYQLSDGSFLVVDGGYDRNDAAEAIYRTMKNKSPSGEVTIAAWILTHCHNDHVGAFCTFSDMHAGDVKLEKLLYNFPNDTQFKQAGQGQGFAKRVAKAKARYYDLQEITFHPGQVLYIRDAVAEVLYTTELLVPQALENFNDSSVVFTLTLAGQKTLITGDCASASGALLLRLYPESLQCGILQVAHHGYSDNSVSPEFYQAVAPDYVLWPSSMENYNHQSTQSNAANRWLLTTIPSARRWVAGSETVSLPLPLQD